MLKKGNLILTLKTAAMATLAVLHQASPALALTTLKQVQVSNGSQIDLLFDGKISKGQLKTEYFNDIIQISMADVAVYPAKISSINGGDLTKVFAYQYAPKLVRCRITVRGKAEDYKDRFKVITTSPGGKVITLALEGIKDGAIEISKQSEAARAAQAAGASRASAVEKADAQARAAEGGNKAAEKYSDPEEKALLERVMSAAAPVPAQEGKQAQNEQKGDKADRSEKQDKKEDARKVKAQGQALGGAKPLPSFGGLFVKLGAVLAAFGILAFGVRKMMNLRQHGAIEAAVTGGKSGTGVAGAIGRFARNGLGRLGGIGGKPKLIEVLSTQHLGPKNSIAVVRVMEQVLVLGISADAISLITQIGDDESGMGLDSLNSLEDLEDLGVLSKHAVKGQASKTSAAASLAALQAAGKQASAAASMQQKMASPSATRGTGATAAGPAVFADLLRNEANRPQTKPVGAGPMLSSGAAGGASQVSRPHSPASRDYLQAGMGAGGTTPQGPAYQANIQSGVQSGPQVNNPINGQSNVRAQIKSRIEGMKQL